MERDRVEVWRDDHGWAHPYPWRFRVHYAGRTYEFGGVPNQCATRHEALARGGWRLRWLRDGTFQEKYR